MFKKKFKKNIFRINFFKYIVIFFIILIVSFIFYISFAKAELYNYNERDYQTYFCNQKLGQLEVTLSDSSRADCVFDEQIMEVDYDFRWQESIGQVLLYATLSNKNPSILLISNDLTTTKYINRLIKAISSIKITNKIFRLYQITPIDLINKKENIQPIWVYENQ